MQKPSENCDGLAKAILFFKAMVGINLPAGIE
jgi:hypothetical protein